MVLVFDLKFLVWYKLRLDKDFSFEVHEWHRHEHLEHNEDQILKRLSQNLSKCYKNKNYRGERFDQGSVERDVHNLDNEDP